MRWILPAAAALCLLALLAFFLHSLPRLPKPVPVAPRVFRDILWAYRQQTGDYPKTAHDVVTEAGPHIYEPAGWKLSFLGDGRLVVDDGRTKMEIDYYSILFGTEIVRGPGA